MASEPCSYCGSTEGLDHLCPGPNALLVGKVLDGRYRIDEILGQGGMGMVFRATQTSVGRPVAVKTLHATLATTPQFFERFRREAEIASRLNHPNIITVYDFGRTADGTCYYVMELLEGLSLKELVVNEGPLSIRRAVNIIEQSARGLAHAHTQNAVHRDLKPHNIMVQPLDGAEYVKVLDFGLVKALEQTEEEEKLTSTGQVLGTPQYMPPEQAGGEDVDQRSDLYSLGGVLFFCLTGTSPYGAKTVRRALQAALTQPVPSVNSKREGAPVPRVIDEFLRKALAKEKKDRHQNAEEFLDDLLNSIGGLSDEVLDAAPKKLDGEPGGTSDSSSKDSKSSGGKPRRPLPVAPRRVSQSGKSPAKPTKTVQPVDAGMTISKPRQTTPEIPSLKMAEASAKAEASRAAGSKMMPIALGVAALLIASVAAVVAMRPRAPATTTAQTQITVPTPHTDPVVKPPEAPKKIAVSFESSPRGALIVDDDGNAIGQTPATIPLARDRAHTFELRLQGYQPKKFAPLDLAHWATDSAALTATLEPAKKAPGKKGHGDAVPIFE
jgi:serine/threonine protein kinase